MRVFLTGATGAIGRPALAALVAGGHEVTAVARTAEKRAAVEAAGAAGATVDLFDAAAVREAVVAARPEAVVNLATSIPPASRAMRPAAWATNDRLRREASAHLVDAALAADAGRYVQESIVFPYPDSGDAWIDALTTDTDPGSIMASSAAAEAQAARFTATGGAGVVLRLGMFYGPGSAHTDLFLRLARWGIGYSAGDPDGYISSIHLDDAASAVVAALGAPPDVYDVVDDEPLRRRDYAAALAATAGRARHVRMPGRAIRLGGAATQPLVRSQRVSNRRFRDATGWAPRYPSARDGYAALNG